MGWVWEGGVPLPTLGENEFKKLNWATKVTFRIFCLAYVKQLFATIYIQISNNILLSRWHTAVEQ